jgi:hypothetical protein
MPDYNTPHDVQPGERVPAGGGVMFLWALMAIAAVGFVVFSYETITGILQAVA